MRNQTRKVVARPIKMETQRQMYILRGNPKNVFILMKLFKKDGNDVESGRC